MGVENVLSTGQQVEAAPLDFSKIDRQVDPNHPMSPTVGQAMALGHVNSMQSVPQELIDHCCDLGSNGVADLQAEIREKLNHWNQTVSTGSQGEIACLRWGLFTDLGNLLVGVATTGHKDALLIAAEKKARHTQLLVGCRGYIAGKAESL